MGGDEYTTSGDRIYRYEGPGRPFEAAPGDPRARQTIGAHLERFLGPPAAVWREPVSHLVCLEVQVFAPTARRPFTTLATAGMSERPMAAPRGQEAMRYAELLLCLPPGWPLDAAAIRQPRHAWPLRLLEGLARFPHQYDTWLAGGHTVPNGDPAAPYAPGVPFCAALLEQPLTLPPSACEARLPGGKLVQRWAVVPLYREELQLKLTRGLAALEALFDRQGVTELLDPDRPNTARRRFLGLF